MKKKAILIISIICFSFLAWAQAPEMVSYQSIIRDADNNLISNKEVGVQISILHGSAEGSAVYLETQNPETNANGLISIKIGGGDTTGDFSAIDWSDGTYYLKVEADPDGGANYSITAVSRILSVPYALHAKTAEFAEFAEVAEVAEFAEVAETFTGYDDMLARIEALEEALDDGDDDNGDDDIDSVTSIDEDFQGYPDHEVIDDNGWTAFAEQGERNWICRTYQGNHYAQATAFNSDDANNTMWMITPPVDLNASAAPVLEFLSAQTHYSHDGFNVYIATDFDGSDVQGASWESLPATLAGENNDWNEWIPSGLIDLSAYSGIVHIAWRYEGSHPEGNNGTFRVNDVLLYDSDK